MELGEMLQVLIRRKRLFLVVLASLTALAVTLSLMQPTEYEANSHILVGEEDVVGQALGEPRASSMQPDRDLKTQAELMRLTPFARRLVKATGLSERELAEQVKVEPVAETGLLVVAARGSTPGEAIDLADAVARTYVGWSRDAARGELRAAARPLEARLKKVGRRLAQTDGAEGRTARAARDAAADEYEQLSTRLAKLNAAVDLQTPPTRVVDKAALTQADPVQPAPVRQGLLGFTLGLIFGTVAVFVRERIGDEVASAAHVEDALGAPVLARVSADAAGPSLAFGRVGGPHAEGYRRLAACLRAALADSDRKVLLVVSGQADQGRALVSVEVATAIAASGVPTALVLADARAAAQPSLRGLSANPGLAEVVVGGTPLSGALHRPADMPLYVLGPGPGEVDSSALLARAEGRRVLEALGRDMEYVVIDASPMLTHADAAVLAPHVGGALVVAHLGESRRSDAHAIAGELGRLGVRLLGAALVAVARPGRAELRRAEATRFDGVAEVVEQRG